MSYVFEPPAPPSLPVVGRDERFPVRRIFCVGRNYAAHAREMGHDPDREPPFFFAKPGDAIVEHGATIPYPRETRDLHFEAELVIAIGHASGPISPAEAPGLVFGYAAGNDLTRRDLQSQAKDLRRPWCLAKGFDRSAVCGVIRPAAEIGHPGQGRITLTVNGETRQDGDLADMIWSGAEIIAHLSRFVDLAPGDLIYTGTPEGVGAIGSGDLCAVIIEGVGVAEIRIAE